MIYFKLYYFLSHYLYPVVGMKIVVIQVKTVRSLFRVDKPPLPRFPTARSLGVSPQPKRGQDGGEMRIHQLSPHHLVVDLKDIYKL